MARDEAYYEAERKIEGAILSGETELDLSEYYDIDKKKLTELPASIGKLTKLKSLILSNNKLTSLPESLGQLKQIHLLDLSHNRLKALPKSFSQLTQLQVLNLYNNQLTVAPDSLGSFAQLLYLDLSTNQLSTIPEQISQLKQLQTLRLSNNQFRDLPLPLAQFILSEKFILEHDNFQARGNYYRTYVNEFNEEGDLDDGDLDDEEIDDEAILDFPFIRKSRSYRSFVGQLSLWGVLSINDNPLNPELAEAYKQGLGAVKAYLRAKADSITLQEAKLILIGEGEVGKTCLMDALLDNLWEKHSSTHGIQIKTVKLANPNSQEEITLNGWDFGGQRVYRPTHQLFFSAPAVYLVVWKPREGSQAGQVKEWIHLVKRREPSAKIFVVATHGGPQQRQPDIDRQELWDLFGKETVVDFFFVDSKPDKQGNRKGIEELKRAIARVAAELPEVGRSVPKSFADVRQALQEKGVPYLPLHEVLDICRAHKMDDEIASLFITISHRLGHLTHYENDPALKDIVILRPDWLASAMSYVLDDEETRNNQGLVKFSHLSILWNDPTRPADTRYPASLHRVFLRLMERFDLSYRVAGLSKDEEANPISLIAQLVPDTTPKEDDFTKAWTPELSSGDIQQTQICRIVDAGNGQSANAEGLFYQLIVRLHKFSLGRTHWDDSVHWQRGLVLDADYNGRALLRHIGNDVHITVRAPYPERFLVMLTEEVKYLVESFWEGLRCDVTVPCLNPNLCAGLFEVEKLIENKRRGRPEQPCPICNEWQSINQLLSNAPAATPPISLDALLKEFAQVKNTLSEVNDNTHRILSQIDKKYDDLIQVFTDEAKEGPRLFSLFPLDGNKFNPQNWVREKFRLVLWCERSRLPLPALNSGDMKKGVYDLELDREWFKIAAPYLKFLTGTLSLVLPVVSSTFKVIDDTAFKTLENQLSLGKNVIDAIAGEGTKLGEVMGAADAPMDLERGIGSRAENATLRELHALLESKDPGFGGLVRVMNKRQEFLWVHERFAGEY